MGDVEVGPSGQHHLAGLNTVPRLGLQDVGGGGGIVADIGHTRPCNKVNKAN